MTSSLLAWAALLLAATAVAQPHPQTRSVPADPADAKAPVRPLAYTSSLAQYKPLKEPEIADWREANRRVTPPAPAASAAPPSHHHHH